MNNYMVVKIDARTGDLELNLPQPLAEHGAAVQGALMEEFAFEPLDKDTLERMNTFVRSWFAGKGITLPEEGDGEPV